MQQCHDSVEVKPCGLFISLEDASLGASPDRLVQCSCHGQGIVEVKCPHSAKDMTVENAANKPQFCLKRSEGGLHLKCDHPYFYQCQLQLHVTGFDYCDFVVWTQKSMHVERIVADGEFIAKHLPAAILFFRHCILPELLSKWYTSQHTTSVPSISKEDVPPDDEDDGTWCYCKRPNAGEMIGCDNKHCPTVWYHMSCLKMKNAPKGKWLCPTCWPSSKGKYA